MLQQDAEEFNISIFKLKIMKIKNNENYFSINKKETERVFCLLEPWIIEWIIKISLL